MKAIKNDNVVNNLCAGCTCQAFNPAVAYTLNSNNVVFTQSTTFDGGDSIKRLLVSVYDSNGKEAHATMTGAGSGATLGTVTFSGGAVTGVPVSAAGTGYTAPPTVVFTGGGGTGALGRAVLNASGGIASITILAGGTGYSSAPTATLVTTSAQVSCVGMDMSNLTLRATVLSTGGCKGDLSMYRVGNANTSGSLTNVNEQGDNNENGNN